MKHLELTRRSNRENGAMLKAVLVRELAKLTQEGLSSGKAIKKLEKRNSEVAFGLPGP